MERARTNIDDRADLHAQPRPLSGAPRPAPRPRPGNLHCPRKTPHMCAMDRPAPHRAMTLIELLMVVALLGILAALAVPLFNVVGDEPTVEVLATNTRTVQLMIVHRSSGSGYPVSIEADWFMGNLMPVHTFHDRAMLVEEVSTVIAEVYPAVKTFDTNDPSAFNAWYNAANGAFCSRVPAQPTDAQTLALFNNVNKTSALAIDQTTD